MLRARVLTDREAMRNFARIGDEPEEARRGRHKNKKQGEMGMPSTRGLVRRVLAGTALVAAGLLGSGVAASEDGELKSIRDQDFVVAFGGYFPYVNSEVKYGSSSGSGATLSLEDDFGLDQWSASAWLSFNWRFQPRHQLHVEFFQLNRDGDVSASSRPIDFGGSVISVGARLESAFDLDIGRVTYGYSIIRDERQDFSFLAGVHIATAKASITATGTISVDGAPFVGATHTESTSSITFPLPHLGLSYSYELTPRLVAGVNVMGFALKINDFTGWLLEVNGLLSYQVTEHFGVGGGLKYYNLGVTHEDLSGNTRFDMQFLGPAIFLYGGF